MGNEQNLIPNSKRTPEELREITRKGGIASGEARRKKRDLREAAKIFLELDVGGKSAETLRSLGVPESDLTNEMVLIASTFQHAIKGDMKAATFLRDTAGMNPNTMVQEAVLEQRKAEFAYQQEKDRLERESYQTEDAGMSTIKVIEMAWRERMEEEQKANRDADNDGGN